MSDKKDASVGSKSFDILPEEQNISHKDIPVSEYRMLSAQLYVKSQQTIPHFYLTSTCSLDRLNAVRSKLNESLSRQDGGKISINDFVIKASAVACKKVPQLNSSWREDHIREYAAVNIGQTVQIDFGPVVPVINSAEAKDLATISKEAKELMKKVEGGNEDYTKLGTPTFVITSLAKYGIKQFASMVAPVLPQAATLAVGAAYKQVVAVKDGFAEGLFLDVTLSCDHRVVDGAQGAMWLQEFRTFLESPPDDLT